MECAGRERGKGIRERPQGTESGVKMQKDVKNRGNELNKSFRINKSLKKRTQNGLDFMPENHEKQ